MDETFSQNFKRIFLLSLTRELVMHSAKEKVARLQRMFESRGPMRQPMRGPAMATRAEQPKNIFMREIGERPEMPVLPKPMIETPKSKFKSLEELTTPIAPPTTKPVKSVIKRFTKPMIKYPLFIPEPRLPTHLEYLRPIPTPGIEIDLFKLNPLVKDPAVRVIEVNPNERVIVSGTMGTKPTDIVLNEEDINRVIDKFSEVSKIPATEGIYKVVTGNLIFSAIISETVSSKFIIKKMLVNPNYQNQPRNQQQRYQTLPFQNDNL